MNLLKTSSLNAVAVIVNLLVGLFLNKILAVYVGPAGYAVIGQFQNAVTMITGFASGAINNGVVKYTAEYSYDEAQQVRVWQTALKIAVYCSLVFVALIAIFHQQLAILFLKSAEYGSIFLWFACFLLFFVLNALLLAILNGKKEVGRYVLANICGSLVMAAVTGILARNMGLYGALLALSINQSVTFVATLLLCCRANWFRLSNLWGSFDTNSAKKLSGFALMALTSAVVAPLSQMLIRNKLGQELGWDAAGYWQGIWKISELYLMVVTTTLSVYYLPRISEITDIAELRREIVKGYKSILPIAILGSVTIFFSRDLIVQLLFTKAFAPMSDLFVFQLIGDVFKIASWLLGYVLWGKALVKIYIVTEVLFTALFVVMSYILIPLYGINGVTSSYLIVYIVYLASICSVLVKYKHI